MSKKNDKQSKKQWHQLELQREKERADKKKAEDAKKQQKLAAKGGITKAKANKGVRIRKGVVVKGVKVVDADTKRKVRSIVNKRRQEKLASVMDVDEPPTARRAKAVRLAKAAKAARAAKAANAKAAAKAPAVDAMMD